MSAILNTNSWALIARGIVAILLAVVTFAVPGMTVAFLVTVFGIYPLIDGALAIFSTVKAVQGHRRWGAFLIEGVVSILFGLYAILAPVAAAAIFVTVIAFWATLTGIAEIFAASGSAATCKENSCSSSPEPSPSCLEHFFSPVLSLALSSSSTSWQATASSSESCSSPWPSAFAINRCQYTQIQFSDS